jgi:hypothetical protein
MASASKGARMTATFTCHGCRSRCSTAGPGLVRPETRGRHPHTTPEPDVTPISRLVPPPVLEPAGLQVDPDLSAYLRAGPRCPDPL